MRTRRFLLPLLLGSASCLGGCANPRTETNVAQALNDAANEISGLKNDLADLQTQMDSLRTTVAKQDTLIQRIMAVNNIPH
jgi:peptidoglycan hydrolase CwlO-like protein